ncbi:hypothetical protein ABB37_03806 [Leptomonas pyrrhocoris]|uniref:Cut9 interacting protein Scn1 n=1 Tax=Leptomonas pyrrhocoris TaxID=157538 RepID=A0A0N0DW79_LEPPY|nr:hypothetical protein ABB37_03806 [Leptomonas pyrrhocoris]KPA81438.1 hypothetical protein ABB37_03806 [Leptomonas pyrrhocoris]|eukprot:XP_015659877.1 hypothetical protein ABB37_03806 [Leptomonas pyrrhocoris]
MQRTMATKAACSFLYDSHCHLREAALCETAETAATAAASSCALDDGRSSVMSIVLCGTHPQLDWDLVAKAIIKPNGVHKIPGFGVHPWLVPASPPQTPEAKLTNPVSAPVAPSAQRRGAGGGCCSAAPADASAHLSLSLAEILAELEGRLRTFPRAIVAEIGLDKLRGPPEAVQKEAFVAQLRIAAAHQRPVSVHCVRHYGLLLQLLQDLPAEDTPPAIILHAFTGSLEVAKSLLNLKNKKRTKAKLKDVPAMSASTQSKKGSDCTEASAPQPKKTKRGGGPSAGTVRINERIFFGVGLSTSFTVKNFSTQTLPCLLSAQKVLLETDAHYGGERDCGCDGEATGGNATAGVYVSAREHAAQLEEVMRIVAVTALQSAELAKSAQASGLAPDVLVRQSVTAAYATAFRSVLH